jgi:hypothetical protein
MRHRAASRRVGSIGWVRGAIFVVGALMVLAGFASIVGSLWLIVVGGFLMIAAVLERRRYRSEAAERSNEPIGPGGGETTAVEPRFRRTDEVFVDPTTQRTMRVLVDPRTGERRYVAEA